MKYILCILAMIGAILMIKYREAIGNSIGEADWMRKVGGVYVVIVFIAIFIFFWSFATLTGTTDFFFAPIINSVPGFHTEVEREIVDPFAI